MKQLLIFLCCATVFALAWLVLFIVFQLLAWAAMAHGAWRTVCDFVTSPEGSKWD